MDILNEFKEYLEKNYDTVGERNTIEAYLRDVKQFITYFKKEFNEDIIDFSRADYTEFKIYMKDKKSYKFSTINRKTASLSIYENFLIENKIRKEDTKIIKKRDFYKIDRPYITRDMLPNNTIKKVRLKAGKENKRDYAMFILLDVGGLSVSELLVLEVERDIDYIKLSNNIITKDNKR